MCCAKIFVGTIFIYLSCAGIVENSLSKSTCNNTLGHSYSCADRSSANISAEDCICYATGTGYCSNTFLSHHSDHVYDESAIEAAFFPFLQGNFGFKYPPLPALNISLSINSEEIKGVSFRLFLPNMTTACRYYDFSSTETFLKKATFYNDDFFFVNSIGRSCTIEIAGLNSQRATIYHKKFGLKIPNCDWLEQKGKPMNISKWQSLITLDLSSYNSEQSMKIAFTTAPQQFNISSYKIRLIEDGVPKSWDVIEGIAANPVVYKWIGGINANKDYFVELTINDEDNTTCRQTCYISSSYTFYFQADLSGFGVLNILLVVTVILIVALGAGLVWMRRQKKPTNYNDVVKVFIVYSHDINQHVEVITLFAKYLQKYCHCEIMLDLWDIGNKDPHLWVNECISSADYILIIWSRGAKVKVSKGNTKVLKNEPGYLGEDLFSCAMTSISAKISQQLRTPHYWRNLRKFINISLSYVPSDVVPSQLDYLPSFRLPSEFNALLCCLHEVGPSPFPLPLLPSRKFPFSCCQCYPSMPFSSLAESPEGNACLDAIAKMHELEIRESNWIKNVLEDGVNPLSHDQLKNHSRNISEGENEDNEQNSGCSVNTESEYCIDISEMAKCEEHPELFPPNILDLPIFGEINCEIPCWPPPVHCNIQSNVGVINNNTTFDEADDPLIDSESQETLPLEIFGPISMDHPPH